MDEKACPVITKFYAMIVLNLNIDHYWNCYCYYNVITF